MQRKCGGISDLHPFSILLNSKFCDILCVLENYYAGGYHTRHHCQVVFAHAVQPEFQNLLRALINENKWRAARYGIDDKLIDFGKERGGNKSSD